MFIVKSQYKYRTIYKKFIVKTKFFIIRSKFVYYNTSKIYI